MNAVSREAHLFDSGAGRGAGEIDGVRDTASLDLPRVVPGGGHTTVSLSPQETARSRGTLGRGRNAARGGGDLSFRAKTSRGRRRPPASRAGQRQFRRKTPPISMAWRPDGSGVGEPGAR